MLFWIKRIARVLGACTFFVVLFISIDFSGPINFYSFGAGVLKGGAGAALFWFVGYVLADILLKGVITDVETDKQNLLDGGLVQRIHTHKERAVPGGPEMPFENEVTSGVSVPVISKAAKSAQD